MLKDLHRIGEEATALYLRTFSPQDKELPVAFKQLVKNIDGSTVIYNKYSFTITVNYSGQRIFFPNQLWYIAAYFTEYYNALDEYVKIIKGELNISDDSIKKAKDNEQHATDIISPTHFDDDTKKSLIRFLSDYKWWYGGKGIERADYYVSPILSLSKLVNASQSYLAELSKYLSKNVEAQEILSKIINEDNTGSSIVEISKTTEHSGGMPAMLALSIKEALAIDNNLQLLSSKWVPNKDGDRLNIGTLNFAVEINKASTLRESDTNKSVTWQWNGATFCISTEISFHRFKDYIEAYNETYSGQLKIVVTEEKGKNVYTLYRVNKLSRSLDDTTYSSYLTALRTKPFMLLAGISGTGKSRIVRKLAQATTTQHYKNDEDRWKDNRPQNFELIQVKPNWHNSMDVVGFYSNISKKYEFTPFVEFIVKAWQDKDTPYFLCLDEMNLAPVEEYFAEFLSAIESRSTDADDNYITDPIIKPFKDFGKEVCEEMLKHLLGEAHHTESNPLAKQFTEKGLTLPPNLMVMGTVNMDETTFSFSRKVLDRAMSVEMNEVDYDKFLSGKSELFPLLTDFNELLVNRPQQSSEVKDKIDSEKVINYLKAVNDLLDGTPFKLGYRAANEAMLYVAANKEFTKDNFNTENALDEFTLMKILSRIEGDDNRLAVDENDPVVSSIGRDKITDAGEDRINLLNCLRAIVRDYIGTKTSTEKKINTMYRTLEREHFVSYWA